MVIAFTLNQTTRERLKIVAEARGSSESELIEAVLLDYLGDVEDLQEAHQRLVFVLAAHSAPVFREDIVQEYCLGEDEEISQQIDLVAVDRDLLKKAHAASTPDLTNKKMVELALQQFLRVEAGKGLISVGGTMPDVEQVSRRKPDDE